ncbi:hypothetical protein A1D17_04030 [Pseudomonas fluorescens]|uniref:Uncharacterized protein n=1 Tax=Pseudomonas fluorescens TaxID=294 RepID=A0A166QQZ4_PSEFL|nr:hypothetical protein A1D17_04030 [Pseudomonas fluorescens]
MTTHSHYKYICRKCQKEHLQPILQDSPADTPIPSCCGSKRDMAFTSVVTPAGGGMSYLSNMLNAQADAIHSEP